MDFKKTLVVILVFVVFMFVILLTGSYAWYSFTNAGTSFDVVTNNDDIKVIYHTGMYIDTTTAVPISSSEVSDYSEKNNFSVDINDEKLVNDILVDVSLINIEIDDELKDSSFKYDLLYNDTSVGSGSFSGASNGVEFQLASSILLETLDSNDFELRIYILDNDSNQNNMMNKTFKGTIAVNVVSRLKATVEQKGVDILVSNITIDGVTSKSLPTSGAYTMSASCSKGSSLSWENSSKTITYASGSKINDSCSLTFTTDSSYSYPLLASVAQAGDYVKYTGNNGCPDGHCDGTNANYVSDTDMGYCFGSSYKFITSGWRVGYISDGTAYLVSAGAPECYGTYKESVSSSTSSQTLSTNYYYGSSYYLNPHTGYFELKGVTSSTVAWSSNYNSIISDTPYTCKSSTKPVEGSTTGACITLYKIDSYSSSTAGLAYSYTSTYLSSSELQTHLDNLDNEALLYCNKDYAYGGVCDSTSTWAMDATDFEAITGSVLSSSSCNNRYSNMACGYTNSLVDNGGNYWYATQYRASSYSSFYWDSDFRSVATGDSRRSLGVRPVLRLQSSILVAGGSGTYKDPYIISNG